MALEVGSVLGTLGARLDTDGFDRFDRRLEKARREAAKPVEAHTKVDDDGSRGLDTFERRLRDARVETAKPVKAHATVEDDTAAPLDRVEGRITRLRRAVSRPITAHADVKADTSGLDRYERQVRQADHANSDFVRGSGRVRTGLGSLFIGGAGVAAAGAGFLALGAGVKYAFGQFQDSEKVGRQTAAVLKSTRGEAGLTAKEINDLATSISNKTGIDDEAIQSSENLLLTFTNVRNEAGKGNDVFTQATGIIQDMSVALGQDSSSSAIQLGKALNDPIKGITALSRVGVSFTKEQKEQVKTLVESGDTLGAQKLILGEVTKEFGGSAEAVATNTGKLKVTLGNLAESVGGFLAPTISKAAGTINTFIHGMQEGTGAGGRFSTWARNAASTVGGVLTTAFNIGKRAIGAVSDVVDENRGRLQNLGRVVGGLAGDVLGAFRQILGAARSTFGGNSGTSRDIRNIITQFLTIVTALEKVNAAVVRRILPGIVTAFRGFALIVRGVIRIISGVLSGDFGKAWDGVKDIFRGAIKLLAGYVRAGTAPIRAAAAAIGKAVGGAFSSAWASVLGTARGFVNGIIDVINIIPGVNIKHVGGGGGINLDGVGNAGSEQAPGGRQTTPNASSSSVGRFARGGKVTQPIAIMGEEAPDHPEWVIPTNPAYRKRAIGLWQATARDLGIPGFLFGGLFDAGKSVLKGAGNLAKDAINTVGELLPHLPSPPTGILGGMGSYVLDKARDFILGHADSFGIGKMVAFANRLDGMDIPYGAAGHGGWAIAAAEDCSSTVSKVLHAGGVPLPSVLTTVGLPGALDSGPGKTVTVHDRALPGDAGHTVIELNGRLFGTSRQNPGGGPGWLSGYDTSALPTKLHPKGYAKGGLFGLDVAGELLGNGTRAYKKGGKTPPKPILVARENSGIKRSVQRGERGIATFETKIQGLERGYDQTDRRFGLSDEVLLIEHDDGSTTVDEGALNARVKELDELARQRRNIEATIQRYRARIASLIKRYQGAIATLKTALGKAKGKARQKERGGYRTAISDYQARITELRGTASDLGFDLTDQRIDLAELYGERDTVKGTKGEAAPPAEAPVDTPAEAPADAPADTPAEATAPTPLDIATAAAEAFSAFTANRADLFAGFGSNFLAAGAGRSSSPTGAAIADAAGTRILGAGTTGELGASAGSGGQVGERNIVINNTFEAPPPDPHTWTQQTAFELAAAG